MLLLLLASFTVGQELDGHWLLNCYSQLNIKSKSEAWDILNVTSASDSYAANKVQIGNTATIWTVGQTYANRFRIRNFTSLMPDTEQKGAVVGYIDVAGFENC
jgi:hypothetical protein